MSLPGYTDPGVDVTTRVVTSTWVPPGCHFPGTILMRLSNSHQQLSLFQRVPFEIKSRVPGYDLI
eukprot:3229130-Rhodomonas_salina.1